MYVTQCVICTRLVVYLLSVSKATKARKAVEFCGDSCYIKDQNEKLICSADKLQNLYYVNCKTDNHRVNTVYRTKENIWHRHLGHLSVKALYGSLQS